ncbi:NAD-dependent protein deacetylase sirtuin-2 [Lobosporangium transversale]|uniref:DHS-like NAD/FAD-binding domain-containing protein n=1 Tax=Lobosporangium transversale TaxID=64571 RepID=A0A1Y2GNR7_9FUNG|nr:DHS-like NAD/FAD-binding domain-containing protein [Lobosporangium transversale]KAF9916247.1 NAD-dependent protein deacetylase sirtuin-2 [Lobosporangium transversale]ORZ14436.1 DHS-like NAD/FAD-binding domain-containing protein [Lobosporangium transversale]|eukprot:XP_021880914.1 DHS-like NAD/FAD-binding domain-containing protein [Lobosporangium transversale]
MSTTSTSTSVPSQTSNSTLSPPPTARARRATSPFTSASANRISIKARPLKPKPEPEPRIQILKDGTISAIAHLISSGDAKNIIVMTGAGISTAAGIKDFRSPGTGLYDDLEKYNLPFPEAVFDLAFFKETPRPFYHLAKHLYPGQYFPTLTHYLLPLLAKKKLLLRSYTQNIDSLERLAGLDEDLLVEAHGSFATAKCVQCEVTTDSAWVKRHIMEGEIPYCKRCSGLVKPSITFFGENLPLRFSTMAETDFDKCDLLIVLGTSLKVEPFNKLIAKVSPKCPRLLINREKAGQELHSGFDFEDKWKYTVQRDAVFLGNCDDGVQELAALCGWKEELQGMYEAGHKELKLAREQERLESIRIKPKREEDEDEDSETEDLGHEDDSDGNKSGTETPESSSSSLDDITYRFEKSTLHCQTESSDESPKTTASSEKAVEDVVSTKLIDVSDNSTDTAKATTTATTPSISTDTNSKGSPLIQVIKQKIADSTATNKAGIETPNTKSESKTKPQEENYAGEPSLSTSTSQPSAPESTVNVSISTKTTNETSKGAKDNKTNKYTKAIVSETPLSSEPAIIVNNTEKLLSISSNSNGLPETSLGCSSTTIYTPLTTATASLSSHQPFSTCIPVTAVFNDIVPDHAVDNNHDSHDSHNDNSSISASISAHSAAHLDGGGHGSRSLLRRKRRKDFDIMYSGSPFGSDLRFSRGICRVTKRRRCIERSPKRYEMTACPCE